MVVILAVERPDGAGSTSYLVDESGCVVSGHPVRVSLHTSLSNSCWSPPMFFILLAVALVAIVVCIVCSFCPMQVFVLYFATSTCIQGYPGSKLVTKSYRDIQEVVQTSTLSQVS